MPKQETQTNNCASSIDAITPQKTFNVACAIPLTARSESSVISLREKTSLGYWTLRGNELRRSSSLPSNFSSYSRTGCSFTESECSPSVVAIDELYLDDIIIASTNAGPHQLQFLHDGLCVFATQAPPLIEEIVYSPMYFVVALHYEEIYKVLIRETRLCMLLHREVAKEVILQMCAQLVEFPVTKCSIGDSVFSSQIQRYIEHIPVVVRYNLSTPLCEWVSVVLRERSAGLSESSTTNSQYKTKVMMCMKECDAQIRDSLDEFSKFVIRFATSDDFVTFCALASETALDILDITSRAEEPNVVKTIPLSPDKNGPRSSSIRTNFLNSITQCETDSMDCTSESNPPSFHVSPTVFVSCKEEIDPCSSEGTRPSKNTCSNEAGTSFLDSPDALQTLPLSQESVSSIEKNDRPRDLACRLGNGRNLNVEAFVIDDTMYKTSDSIKQIENGQFESIFAKSSQKRSSEDLSSPTPYFSNEEKRIRTPDISETFVSSVYTPQDALLGPLQESEALLCEMENLETADEHDTRAVHGTELPIYLKSNESFALWNTYVCDREKFVNEYFDGLAISLLPKAAALQRAQLRLMWKTGLNQLVMQARQRTLYFEKNVRNEENPKTLPRARISIDTHLAKGKLRQKEMPLKKENRKRRRSQIDKTSICKNSKYGTQNKAMKVSSTNYQKMTRKKEVNLKETKHVFSVSRKCEVHDMFDLRIPLEKTFFSQKKKIKGKSRKSRNRPVDATFGYGLTSTILSTRGHSATTRTPLKRSPMNRTGLISLNSDRIVRALNKPSATNRDKMNCALFSLRCTMNKLSKGISELYNLINA